MRPKQRENKNSLFREDDRLAEPSYLRKSQPSVKIELTRKPALELFAQFFVQVKTNHHVPPGSSLTQNPKMDQTFRMIEADSA